MYETYMHKYIYIYISRHTNLESIHEHYWKVKGVCWVKTQNGDDAVAKAIWEILCPTMKR